MNTNYTFIEFAIAVAIMVVIVANICKLFGWIGTAFWIAVGIGFILTIVFFVSGLAEIVLRRIQNL